MNKKRFSIILKIAVILLVLAAISGCSLIDAFFGTYTIKATSYISNYVWIQYRENGTTEWKDANLYDDDGNTVLWLSYDDVDYPHEAYFNVPGDGIYDFRGINILGYTEGAGSLEECEVVYSNQEWQADFVYYLTISNSGNSFY